MVLILFTLLGREISHPCSRIFFEEPHPASPTYFFFSFLGNHPFSTRFFWSKTSLMDQNEENATTPKTMDQKPRTNPMEQAAATKPDNRKAHQERVPK